MAAAFSSSGLWLVALPPFRFPPDYQPYRLQRGLVVPDALVVVSKLDHCRPFPLVAESGADGFGNLGADHEHGPESVWLG